MRNTTAGVALAVVLLATLVREVGEVVSATWLGAAAISLYLLLQWPTLPNNARWLLALAGGGGVLAMPFVDELPAALAQAARTVCYYTAFFAATGFLRMAAESSPLIGRCGAHLLAQPAGRQYLAMTFGTNLMGLILSFGAIQLLGTMVGRAVQAAGGPPEVREARQKRLSLAVLRGICMAPAWSPFSVSLAMALALAPGADWLDAVALGFVAAFGLMLLGWLLEHGRGGDVMPVAGSGTWGDQGRLIVLVLAIFAIVVAAEEALDLRLIIAVMLMVPIVAMIWIAWQLRMRGPSGAAAELSRRLSHQVRTTFPAYRAELAILASAGFGGTLIAAALPRAQIAQWLVAADLPAAAVPILITALIVLGGQLALNPIISITVITAVLPPLAAIGTPPALAAVASMLGFALAVGASPFMLFTLMTARLAGRPAGEVAYRWNGRFTILAMLAVAALFVAASAAMT